MSEQDLLGQIQGLPLDKRVTLARLLAPTKEPIAIVGIGCRFPGLANGPKGYWRMLCAGTEPRSSSTIRALASCWLANSASCA